MTRPSTFRTRGVLPLATALAMACGDQGDDPPGSSSLLAMNRSAATACQAATPAQSGGALAWVDAAGVWLAAHEQASSSVPVRIDEGDSGATPQSPIALGAARAPGAPAFVVPFFGSDHCELRAYDGDGVLLWQQHVDTVNAAPGESVGCVRPSGAGRYLVWPHTPPAGDPGRVTWVDTLDGRSVVTVVLDAAPLTPAAALGTTTAAGGGSHWLVGTALGLVALDDPLADQRVEPGEPSPPALTPGVLATWPVPAGERVTGVRAADATTAVVTLAATDDPGPGHRLRFVALASESPSAMRLTTLGTMLSAPGPLTMSPLTARCDAQRTPTWFCGRDVEAAVLAAGDGWLGAWAVPSGEPLFVHEALGLEWTGLAIGRGGWLAGGGSHWLPAGPSWRLVALDPARAAPSLIELAGGPAEACVPSPLWDTDGRVAVPVIAPRDGGSALVRSIVPAPRPGLAAGSSRALGDARSAGVQTGSDDACVDGAVRRLASYELGDDIVYGVRHGFGQTIAFGTRAEAGLLRWLEGSRRGRERVLSEANTIEQALYVADDQLVLAYFDADGSGHAWLAAFTGESHDPDWRHLIDADAGSLVGLVQLGPTGFIVAAHQGDQDVLFAIDAALGLVDRRAFGSADEPHGIERLLPDGQGGAFMILATEGALVVRRVDETLAPLATAVVSSEFSALVDAAADSAGTLRLLYEVRGASGDLAARWSRLERDLVARTERDAPAAGPFASNAAGASLIASLAGLTRVSAGDAFGLTQPLVTLPDGVSPLGVAPASDGFVAAWSRITPTGLTLLLARADHAGFAGCAAVGRCLDDDPARCDRAEACVMQGCDPATGACQHVTSCEASP